MPKYAKRWLWSWVAAGLAAPFLLAAVGHLVPPVPETGIFDPPPVLTAAQSRFRIVSESVFPGQFTVGFLSLLAMDSGDDTSFFGVIILIVAVLTNAVIYALAGFMLLIFIEGFRSATGRRSFLE